MDKKLGLLLILSSLILGGCFSNSSNTSSSSASTSNDISVTSSQTTTSELTSSGESTSSTNTSTSTIEEKVVVSFDTLGGPTYKSIEYNGSPLTLPTPEYYHHDFLGWYESPSYEGEKVNSESYTPSSSITLTAKWDEVLYIYFYYGTSTDHERFSVHEGDEINLNDLYSTSSCVIEGVECPFLNWVNDYTDEVVSNNLTMGSEDLILVASYDTSEVPHKTYLTDLGNGSYEHVSKTVAKQFYKGDTAQGYIEADITVIKGKSGGSGLFCHGSLAKIDYAYETNCNYIAAVVAPSNGSIDISYINGSWHRIGIIALASLPKSYQERYNNTPTSLDFTCHMGIVSFENQFSIFVDNEVVYTCSDILATTGVDYSSYCGFGVRSSCVGAIFSNFNFKKDGVNITLDFRGARDNVSYYYFGGNIPQFSVDTPNYVANGWSFDLEGTDEFNYSKASRLNEGSTLYAKLEMLTSPLLVSLGNDRYKTTGNVEGLIGLAEDETYEIEMEMTITKYVNTSGHGGIGIIFKGSMLPNQVFGKGGDYLMAELVSNGTQQIAYVKNGTFAHLACKNSKSTLQSDFAALYNAANDGDYVPAKIKVAVTSASTFEFYVNDELINTSNDVASVSYFTGNGYGVRANAVQVGSEFTYKYLGGNK